MYLLLQNIYAGYPGSSGVDFIKMSPAARPASLANTYTSLKEDITVMFFNPAGVATLTYPNIVATYNYYLETIKYACLIYGYPLEEETGTFSTAFSYLFMDSFTGYDADDKPLTDKISSSDMMFIFGYSRKVTELAKRELYAGMNLHFISEKLYTYTATGISIDLGINYNVVYLEQVINCGVSILNLGPAIIFISDPAPLPTSIKLGASTELLDKSLLISLDLGHSIDKPVYFSIGTEYIISKMVPVRLGISTSRDTGDYFSLGAGVKLNNVNVDFAYIPYGKLGNNYQVSITMRFSPEWQLLPEEAPLVDLRKANRLYQEGLTLMSQEDYLNAIDKFAQVLIIKPENKEALEKLEECYKKIVR